MNQFDEFFKDKLNEEQSFSGQKRSWAQLNRELQLIEKGSGITSKSLALWKALGVVAVLISITLVWERQHLVEVNEQLKTKLNERQSEPATENKTAVEIKPAPETSLHTAAANDAPAMVEPTNSKGASPAPTLDNQSISSEVPLPSVRKNGDSPKPAKQGVKSRNKSISPEKDHRKVDFADQSIRQPEEKQAASGIEKQPATQNDVLPEQVENAVPEADAIAQPVIPASDSLKTEPAALSAAQEKAQEPPAAESVVSPDSVKAQVVAKTEEKIIDPVRNGEKRWRAGIRAVLGFAQPKEKGVSAISGQGIGMSFRFWDHFSVTASADFLKFDVDAPAIPAHCSDIELPLPGPVHHFFDLKNVSVNRTMQQYSAGLSYTRNLAGAWNVSLSAAHTWSSLPSRLVSFEFEEIHGPGPGPGHPEPEFLAGHTHKIHLSNLWRLGAGMSYELPRWSFGFRGDYSKNFDDSRPSLDVLAATAEVLYKF